MTGLVRPAHPHLFRTDVHPHLFRTEESQP